MKYSLEKSPGENAINLIFVGQKLNPHHTHFHSYDITKFNQIHCFGILFSFLYVVIILCVFFSCFSVYLFVHYIKIFCLGILIVYIAIGTILVLLTVFFYVFLLLLHILLNQSPHLVIADQRPFDFLCYY